MDFRGFQFKGGVLAEGLTQTLIKLAGLSSGPCRTSDVLLMFMAFSLLPSCLPIMPPDTVQAVGGLGQN
jgi:hypothetical protein